MKIPTKENIPGREEFKTRFQRKLRGVSKIFEPLIDQLAEEAESVIYGTWLQNSDPPPPKEDPFINVVLKSKRNYEQYYCSNCATQKIHPSHNFCPHCGISVKWIK